MAINADAIKSNSIVKVIVSPAFTFNDPAVGQTNKIAVLNRVKNMSQADRNELMQDLDHVIGKLNKVPNVPSLKERGLCTVLLSDDGKRASKSGFIVSFVCGFLNLIGLRTGSDAVMKKLEEAKNALNMQLIVPGQLDVKNELEAEIARLGLEIKAQAPAEKAVQALIASIKEIRTTDLTNLRDANWNNISTFIDLEESLEVLKQKAEKTGQKGTKAMVGDSIASIKKLTVPSKGFRGSFDNNKWGILQFISTDLRKLEGELEGNISLIQNKKQKLQKGLALVQNRLLKFEENQRNVVGRKEFGDSQAKIKDAAQQIQNLDEILVAIESLSNKNGSFLALRTAVGSINSHLQNSRDDIKNVKDFGPHFDLLAQLASGDPSLNKQQLAAVIDLNVLSASSANSALLGRLSQFTSNPDGDFLDTEDGKKQLINDYVAYWKILFTGLRGQEQQKLETAKAKVLPKKAAKPPEAPKPVATVAAPVPALPDMFNIPASGSGNTRLRAIAIGLQNNREDSKADYTWYGQVKTPDIEENILTKVYGNFYKTMKNLKQLGSLTADGESTDPAWGTNVFTTGKSNNVAPDLSRPLLNHYRVQAIVDALKS